MHLHLEHGVRAGQLIGVVLREGHVDFLILAGLDAHKLILKAGDEGAGAEVQAVIGAFSAAEGFAVLIAVEVDDDGVAGPGGTVHLHDAAVALADGLDLKIDVLFRDLSRGLVGRQTLVLAQGRHGIQGGFKGDRQRLVLADLVIRDGGIAHGALAAGIDAGTVRLQRQGIDGLVMEHVLAVHTLDHRAGRLASAEAGDGDALLVAQIRLVDRRLERRGVDGDVEGHFVVFFFDVFGVHGVSSSYIIPSEAFFIFSFQSTRLRPAAGRLKTEKIQRITV